jgi:hypothetical protein
MLLRDHPLMFYKGNRSWPPAWLWTAGYDNTHPQGEIGILKAVLRSHIQPPDRCFLIMEHCGAEYVGALLLNNPAFCAEIVEVLMQHLGETVRQIGDIDLSYTMGSAVLLRDHPLMRYHGVSNWPPSWLWIDGPENKHPRGEVGILTAVEVSNVPPSNRCFLCIDYAGSSYMGCLLFDDCAFRDQIVMLLRGYLSRPIAEIGSIDLAHTL